MNDKLRGCKQKTNRIVKSKGVAQPQDSSKDPCGYVGITDSLDGMKSQITSFLSFVKTEAIKSGMQ